MPQEQGLTKIIIIDLPFLKELLDFIDNKKGINVNVYPFICLIV